MKSSQTNTFTGGMQKDLHPMITPPNVLTDALNATIVTMNGNENVLQNDMGNARIESAYLPAGYEPVGMKEYGGIIYVASYNPQSGKGQIGSFPSPERNIDSSETESSIINLWDIFNNYKDDELVTFTKRFKILTNESQPNRNIYPGDKFSLYADLTNIKKFLSHYNTYSTDINNSYRKNNLITLDVAVLDNNSNLRIITDQLKRFDSDGTAINFDSEDSLEKKLNTGYFIQNTTKEGSKVDSEREKNAVNTYNNKVAGQLYLVETINAIQKFNIETDYEIIDKDTIDLKFICHYLYNCPEDYIQGIVLDINGTEFDILKNSTEGIWNEDEQLYELINTYTKRVKKTSTGFSIQEWDTTKSFEGDIINYTITPYMTFSKMSGLKVTGNININKINSGEISINTWKYLVANNKIQLTLGLDAYIKETDHIEYIKLDFYDILHNECNSPQKTIKIDGKKNYSGIFTNNIDLPLSTVYKVKLYYKYINKEAINLIGTRTIISTPLLNDFYYDKNDYDKEVLNDGDNKKDLPFTLEIDTEIIQTPLSRDPEVIKVPSYKLVVAEKPSENNIIEQTNKQVFKNLITITPHLKNQENYPISLNVDKLQFQYDNTKTENTIVNKTNGSNIEINDKNKINISVNSINSQNIEVDTEQIITNSILGNYYQTKLTFSNMFRNIDSNNLFGFNPNVPNSWWWIMPLEWVHGRSGHRDKIWGIIYQANYGARFSEEPDDRYEEIYAYDDDTRSDGDQYRDIMSSKHGIYNSIQNYLKNTQGTPNVVLFAGNMNNSEVQEDGNTRKADTDWYKFGSSLRPMNNYQRNYNNDHSQFEYLWWLGTDNNYHLLSDFIISKGQDNNSGIAWDHTHNKTDLYFPKALNNLFKNVLIYTDESYEANQYYIYNVLSEVPQTSNIELSTSIQLKTSVQKDHQMFIPFKEDKSYMSIMNDNCKKLGCTLGFHFVYDVNNLMTSVKINNSSQIKGMEDIYSKISDLNANKTLVNAVEIDNKIYFYDIEGKEFNSASLYIKDDEGITKLDKSNSILSKLFTYQNGNIVVRYEKLENKKGDWKYYDRSGDGKGQLTFAHMPSFSIPGLSLLDGVNVSIRDHFEQKKLNS